MGCVVLGCVGYGDWLIVCGTWGAQGMWLLFWYAEHML